MPSILDETKYPMHLSEAQELHTVLTQITPTAAMALLAADKAGKNSVFHVNKTRHIVSASAKQLASVK